MAPQLILASGSPRRRVLLAMLGVEVDAVAPDIDEPAAAAGHAPIEAALAVAEAKVRALGQMDRPVLAADTIVVCNGSVLGKPADRAEAQRMVLRQMGQTISVISAVAAGTPDGKIATRHATSLLEVDTISDERLAEYLATGEADDKAGALAVQGAAKHFVHLREGSRSNVYGLPLAATIEVLGVIGVEVTSSPAMG